MALRAYEQQGVGDRLRHARDERGIDLDRAASETRIERRFLEALEADAATDAYPGPLFARAFLREYARYLGLNPRPLVEAYRSTHPERDWPFMGGPERSDRGSSWFRAGVALLFVVAAIAATVVASRPDTADTLRVPEVAAPSAGNGDGRTLRPRGPESPPARGIRLRIRLLDEISWIAVVAGERELISGTQNPGFARTFRHRRGLDVVIGNADAARVTLNGEPLELVGAEDDVYRAEIRFRDGRVRVLPED